MSSGKQLSFALGEISPEVRYNTEEALYSKALKKLNNGYVKKGGGVSNRAGTKHVANAAYQERITTQNSKVGVRIFPFYFNSSFYLIELKDRYDGITNVLAAYSINDLTLSAPIAVTVTFDSRFTGEVYDLAQVSYSQLNNSLTISVPRSGFDGINNVSDYKTFIISVNVGVFTYTTTFPRPTAIGVPSPGALTINCYGTPALLNGPVTYLTTQEQDDGTEVLWQKVPFIKCNPNIECQSTVDKFDATPGAGIKQYLIYRSAGNGDSHYSLVGRIPPKVGGVIFDDFLASPDITVQPPIDDYLYPVEPDGIYTVTRHLKALFYYRGRAVIIYHPYKPTGSSQYKYSPGQFGLSKIGAPKMFGRPLTPNLIDAFSATIPTDKIADITNYMVTNRLILFTKDNAIIIKGGENGVLTPQTVNPEVIYHEGCAADISPVASGTRGFFVTPDKTKLLMLRYGTDDTLSINDVSIFSGHLFETRDIRTMAMIPGADNVLWILKTTGQLISLSFSEEGTVQAFATHETDGFIEDITSIELPTFNFVVFPDLNDLFAKRAYGLVLSVIREGTRRYETMAVRNDINTENFLFSDATSFFGSVKNDGFRRVNITTSTDYNGGSTLTLTDLNAIGSLGPAYNFGDRIVFKYIDPTLGEMQIRIIVTGDIDVNTIQGYAEEDLPAYLQDIEAQALTSAEKIKRQQNYLKATNLVTGLTHLANREVSVFAEGQVISSPLNPDIGTLTVEANGDLYLPDFYTYGYVGIPYTFEMETLDLDASDARTFTDKGKLINSSGVALNKTIGGFIGARENNQEPTFEALTIRETYGNTTPTESITEVRNVPFPGSWNMKGSVVIRQVDPLPITVLAVYPKGVIGD